MKATSKKISEALPGSLDLETAFFAEMRARRERLAKLLRLIEDELRAGRPARSLPRPSHKCKGLAARKRSPLR